MTFEQMKEIEPGLGTLEREIISRNEDAKEEEIYWSDVWADIKPAFEHCVGVFASQDILKTTECWDVALAHFSSLVTDMK